MKQQMKYKALSDLFVAIIPSASGRNAASAVRISMLGFIHEDIGSPASHRTRANWAFDGCPDNFTVAS